MQQLSIEVQVSALVVFLQGILSFFSPCVLPLLPVYIGYLSGGTVTTDEKGALQVSRIRVMCNTICFVLGISVTFLLLGLAMSAVGRAFYGARDALNRIGGILILLFGLYQLGVIGANSLLSREHRFALRLDKIAVSPLTAFVVGFLFSFGWTPCIGPALSSVLIMTATAANRSRGLLLIGLYTLGFVLPFLLTGLASASLLAFFRKRRGVVRYARRIGGVLMVVIGVLMLFGGMDRISAYLAGLS